MLTSDLLIITSTIFSYKTKIMLFPLCVLADILGHFEWTATENVFYLSEMPLPSHESDWSSICLVGLLCLYQAMKVIGQVFVW
jgi:hypothetical protein